MPVIEASLSDSKKETTFENMEYDTPYRAKESGWSDCLVFKLRGVDDKLFYVNSITKTCSYTIGFGMKEINRNKYHFFTVPGDKITFGV